MKHPRIRPPLIASRFARLRRDAVDLRIVNDVREGRAAAEGPAYRAKYRLPDTAPQTICSAAISSEGHTATDFLASSVAG